MKTHKTNITLTSPTLEFIRIDLFGEKKRVKNDFKYVSGFVSVQKQGDASDAFWLKWSGVRSKKGSSPRVREENSY